MNTETIDQQAIAREQLADVLIDVITTIRDSYPRVPNDAPTSELIDAIMAIFKDCAMIHPHIVERYLQNVTLKSH